MRERERWENKILILSLHPVNSDVKNFGFTPPRPNANALVIVFLNFSVPFLPQQLEKLK